MDRLTGSALLAVMAFAVGGCFDAGAPIVGSSDSAPLTTTTSAGTTVAETTTTTTTTGTTTTGMTTETTTTTGDLEEPDAYRITELTVVDPHIYFVVFEGGECADVTNILNAWLLAEINNGDSSQALVFSPATAEGGAQTPLRMVHAQCNGGLDTCSEIVEAGDMPVMSVATNKGAGTCSVVLPGTWNTLYSEDGTPNVSNAPCFSSELADGTIRLSGIDSLPAVDLSDIQISASYTVSEGGKVTSLLTGTIRGYLRQSEAMMVEGMIDGVAQLFNFWGAVGGGGGCQVDMEEFVDDTDPNPAAPRDMEAGVWLYLNFEATKVEWLE